MADVLMDNSDTSRLLELQAVCEAIPHKISVGSPSMGNQGTPKEIGRRVRAEREARKWSQGELANRISGLLRSEGSTRTVKQQSIDQLEKGKPKTLPDWTRFVWKAFEAGADEMGARPDRLPPPEDDTVLIRRLPTWVGLGTGGTGDDDEQMIRFSRDLVERELRADPDRLLCMVAEGNSMEPQFLGGDQILVDTRKLSLAQPGAFCLWDGDGHVIKYLERIPGSDPAKVRVIAANDIYETHERLLDDIRIVGRVVWFGRRIQ